MTGHKVSTFYDVNETWHSKFGEISSAYEECRADGVGLYLSCVDESLDILLPNLTKEERSDVVYMLWYRTAQAGIIGLEYYNP